MVKDWSSPGEDTLFSLNWRFYNSSDNDLFNPVIKDRKAIHKPQLIKYRNISFRHQMVLSPNNTTTNSDYFRHGHHYVEVKI